MEEIEFKHSLWDAGSIVYTGIFGKAASTYVVLLLLLNAFGQCMFLYIVANTQLSESEWNGETVEQLNAMLADPRVVRLAAKPLLRPLIQ